MIADLKPYAEYKESGIAWLGRVPRHWVPTRLKHAFKRIIGGSTPASGNSRNWNGDVTWVTPADVSRSERLHRSIRQISRVGMLSCSTEMVPKGSIILTSRAPVGNVAIAEVDLCTNQGCKALIPDHTVVAPMFGFWLLSIMKAELQSLSTGTTFSEVSTSRLASAFGVLPPPDEQAAIVRFLDHADRRIRRYILAKQKLIKLLEEQKQAIIHRAVTRGFVDHLPLNILGLPQQIAPFDGWTSLSVGHLIQKGWLTIQDGNHGELHPKASEYVDQGIPFLMAKDVRPEGLNFTECAKITEERARQLRIGFAIPGDVLLTHKASIGQIGRVPQELAWPFVMLTPQVTYYRSLTNQITGTYLLLYMQSRAFQEQLEVLSLNQSTRPYIGLIEQRNLVICFPSVERQGEIISAYEADVRSVDGAIENNRKQIYLFREYRTRLTADVVTGKLDARAAAANLPEEADEVEATSDIDALAESEDDAPEVDLEVAPEEAEA